MTEFEKISKQITQRDLDLVGTRVCVRILREATELNLSEELRSALFQLLRKVARMEWGPETEVDDFSEPGFFLITTPKKTKRL